MKFIQDSIHPWSLGHPCVCGNNSCFFQKGLQRRFVSPLSLAIANCHGHHHVHGFLTTHQKMGFVSFGHIGTGEPIKMNFPSWSLTLVEILIYPLIPLTSFYYHNILALHSRHVFTQYSQVFHLLYSF